ncbi:MAG: hypothetical protein HKN44_13375 [Ilumatobacter sp.]|nr:hypothetical protein [Ilumatobacter sp.]
MSTHRTIDQHPAASVWTVSFLPPAKRLSMNDRPHWRTRHRLTKLWRHAAHTAACAQLGRAPSERARGACMVRVEFPVADPGRRRDPHNQAPTVKAIIDGLVDAAVWPDDTDDHVVVLDPRFYKPDQPLMMAKVVVNLIPRAGDLPT